LHDRHALSIVGRRADPGTEGNDQVLESTPITTFAAAPAAGSGVPAATTPRPPRA